MLIYGKVYRYVGLPYEVIRVGKTKATLQSINNRQIIIDISITKNLDLYQPKEDVLTVDKNFRKHRTQISQVEVKQEYVNNNQSQTNIQEDKMEKPAKNKRTRKTTAKASNKKAAAEKTNGKAAVKQDKKPGVIATIASMIEGSGKTGVSKDEILKVLVKNFPDKKEDSMRNTVNIQVPNRINNERFKVKRLESGNYVKA